MLAFFRTHAQHLVCVPRQPMSDHNETKAVGSSMVALYSPSAGRMKTVPFVPLLASNSTVSL
ncbi:hypothetical protein GBAR_LOCUS25135 [Geodia barretti]|uniref:Uncharacterized protein n=1 Tax=Geodia barretti TaxID=519541 RepID=A0AA35TEF0_GEOBA|nr:hypothetical protein GBAR_LOCUS25135 [Geodia barretti]